MANLTAIDYHTHKHLRINPEAAELHGAKLNMIPVVVSEFTNLAVQYPIVIAKNEETGQFSLSALFGFEQYENLYWQNGEWQGLYLPLQIRRQPFFVGNTANADDGDKNLVCIDTNSPTIVTSDNQQDSEKLQTLFNNTGSDSPYFETVKQYLAQLIQGEYDNKNLLKTLAALDLIQPLALEITFVNGQNTRLNGLYTVNQDKLATLNAEQVARLHQEKLLQPIYTMVTSLGQIYALIERKNQRL